MKFILSTLLFLACFISTGQTISTAVYKDCFDTESPHECSSEKLRTDITNLISEDITKEIKSSSAENYFSVSLAFLSDEKGKTIPETIEISCEHELLSDAIKKYLSELPLFEPKNNDDKEKRSVHIGYYVFLYDNDNHKYYPITKDEAAEANIKPVFVYFGTPPSLKGCESNDKEAEQKCSKEKISQKVAKKINPNKIKGEPRTIKLFANFTVEKNGEVTIKEITCSEDNEELIEQYRKALGKIPDFNPGTFRGIPVRSNYTLPVTINLQ